MRLNHNILKTPNLWLHILCISPEDKNKSSNYKEEEKAINKRNTDDNKITMCNKPTSVHQEIEKMKDLLCCPAIFWNPQLYSYQLNLQIRMKTLTKLGFLSRSHNLHFLNIFYNQSERCKKLLHLFPHFNILESLIFRFQNNPFLNFNLKSTKQFKTRTTSTTAMTETIPYRTARIWKIRSCHTGDSFTSDHQLVASFKLSATFAAAEEDDEDKIPDEDDIISKPPRKTNTRFRFLIDLASSITKKIESIESLLLSPSPSSVLGFCFIFFHFFVLKVFIVLPEIRF